MHNTMPKKKDDNKIVIPAPMPRIPIPGKGRSLFFRDKRKKARTTEKRDLKNES